MQLLIALVQRIIPVYLKIMVCSFFVVIRFIYLFFLTINALYYVQMILNKQYKDI